MTNSPRWPAVVVGASMFMAGILFSEAVMDPRQQAARASIAPPEPPEAPSLYHTFRGCRSATEAMLTELQAFRQMYPQWRESVF